MNSKGILYIISAASGTGKSSLAKALVESMENIKISISHTTRPIRANEQDGKDYFFVTNDEFENLVEKNLFLEYARVFGSYYGTSRGFIEEQLNSGIDLILDIDWQGARKVREEIECTSIFLLPPSQDELRSRLEKRKREDANVIEKRLAAASSEISHYKEFDYVVINDKFEDALLDLQAIIRSDRLSLARRMVQQSASIQELLG